MTSRLFDGAVAFIVFFQIISSTIQSANGKETIYYPLHSINITCKGSYIDLIFTYDPSFWKNNASAITLTNQTEVKDYPNCGALIFDGGSSNIQTMKITYSKCPIIYHPSHEANTKFVQLDLTLKSFSKDSFTEIWIDYALTAKCYYRIQSNITFSIDLSSYNPGGNTLYVTPGHGGIVVNGGLVPQEKRPQPNRRGYGSGHNEEIIVTEPAAFPPNTFHGNGDSLEGLTTNLISPPDDLNQNISYAYLGQSAVMQIKLTTQESYTSILLNECFFSNSEDPENYDTIASFITDDCPDPRINQFTSVVNQWDVSNGNTTYQVYYKMISFNNNPMVYLHCSIQFCTSEDKNCRPKTGSSCPWNWNP